MKYDFDELYPRENTDCLKYDLRKVKFGKEDVMPFWVADMDFRTPEFVMEALRKRLNHENFGYPLKPTGYHESIINWLDMRYNWKVKKSWISYSPGVVPSIVLSLKTFTKPGDKVMIQPPVYFPFIECVENHGRQLVYNQLQLKDGRYEMDFEDMEKKMDSRVKMLILCHPHNPGGSVWRKDELEKMARICKEKEVLIFSDEIHSDLMLWGNKHIPTASISPEIADITITAMAPSKTFNLAGMSTSFLVMSNKSLFADYENMLNDYHLGFGNTLGFEALKTAYSKGEEWLGELLAYLEESINFIEDYLDKNLPGVYSIRIGDPETDTWKEIDNLRVQHPGCN